MSHEHIAIIKYVHGSLGYMNVFTTCLIIAICSWFIVLEECVHNSFDYSNVFMAHWVTGMCSCLMRVVNTFLMSNESSEHIPNV
jgi:hypothetical protein